MKKLNIFLVILAVQSLVACGEVTTRPMLDQINDGYLAKTERPACEVNRAEYTLDTSVISFEAVSDTGASFGFNLLKGFLKVFDISFRLKTAKLFLGMTIYDPSDTARVFDLKNVSGESTLKESELKVNLGLSIFGVGFQNYYKTPISTLVEKGLTQAMANMNSSISGLQIPWSATVLSIRGEDIYISAGSFAGVKEGDQFNLYNVDYVWEGEACSSPLIHRTKTTALPLAVAEVVQLGPVASLVRIVPNSGASDDMDQLLVGARVEVAKLVVENKKDVRTLRRTLEIGNIHNAKVPFQETDVDFSGFVSEQIKTVADKAGYSVYRRRN